MRKTLEKRLSIHTHPINSPLLSEFTKSFIELSLCGQHICCWCTNDEIAHDFWTLDFVLIALINNFQTHCCNCPDAISFFFLNVKFLVIYLCLMMVYAYHIHVCVTSLKLNKSQTAVTVSDLNAALSWWIQRFATTVSNAWWINARFRWMILDRLRLKIRAFHAVTLKMGNLIEQLHWVKCISFTSSLIPSDCVSQSENIGTSGGEWLNSSTIFTINSYIYGMGFSKN